MKYILLISALAITGCTTSYTVEHDNDQEMIVDEEYTGPMPFMPADK